MWRSNCAVHHIHAVDSFLRRMESVTPTNTKRKLHKAKEIQLASSTVSAWRGAFARSNLRRDIAMTCFENCVKLGMEYFRMRWRNVFCFGIICISYLRARAYAATHEMERKNNNCKCNECAIAGRFARYSSIIIAIQFYYFCASTNSHWLEQYKNTYVKSWSKYLAIGSSMHQTFQRNGAHRWKSKQTLIENK